MYYEQQVNNLPKDILWTNSFDKGDFGPYGSMSLIDDKGNLIWYRSNDFGLPDSFYFKEMDPILRKYLGEPSEHPVYQSMLYESTDFSQDGEIVVLQTASVGKGIDIVFTVDGLVDKDFVENGIFDRQVNRAMEYFFAVEPYKSLRDRFNVYAVKAVSVNNHKGYDHAFNQDLVKVWEYVSKIPGIKMENTCVTVINYNPIDAMAGGESWTFENGLSISFIQAGNASPVVIHEAGGHGVGKLADEYIYPEYEHYSVPDDERAAFEDFFNDYHSKGWYMNVSTTDVVDDVPWANFLRDDRYKNDVGVYKGAWRYPNDLWRPTENSIMNETAEVYGQLPQFNAPSREAIYKIVMQLSEGEDWTYDYETFVEFDRQAMARQAKSAAATTEAHRKLSRKSSKEKTRKFIHRAPKMKKFVDGHIEDVPSPFRLSPEPDNYFPTNFDTLEHSSTGSTKAVVQSDNTIAVQ